MDRLGCHRPEGFCYPKFHANRKYPELIRRKGSVALASAGYGESTHKLIKRAWDLSNKKSAGLERQVSNNPMQPVLRKVGPQEPPELLYSTGVVLQMARQVCADVSSLEAHAYTGTAPACL